MAANKRSQRTLKRRRRLAQRAAPPLKHVRRHVGPFAVVSLLILTTACSEPETDTPQESTEVAPTEDPIEQVVPGSGTDTLGRLEECELDETTERRIRALGEDLEQMLLRYTERHPDVVATREALEELEQAALSDCVERLQ